MLGQAHVDALNFMFQRAKGSRSLTLKWVWFKVLGPGNRRFWVLCLSLSWQGTRRWSRCAFVACMLSPGLDLSQDGLSQQKCTKTRGYQGEHPEFDHWPEVWSIWNAKKIHPAAFWVAMPGVVLGYVSTFVDSVPQSLLLHSGPISWWVNSPVLLLVSPRKPELLPENVTFLGQITQRLMLHFPC